MDIKLFFMLNSSEHRIYHLSTIVGILTFISMINAKPDGFKDRNIYICHQFSFYEQLKSLITSHFFHYRTIKTYNDFIIMSYTKFDIRGMYRYFN